MKTQPHVLLIGYSNISRKRFINYFIKKKIRFSIATRSYKGKIDKVFNQYNNYNIALKNSKANIAYISLPNSLHYVWAKKALELGYHVIVDKPICKQYLDSFKLINLAKKKNRLISEATFFNYHRQIKKALKIVQGKKNISKVYANFTIPLPPKNSILLSRRLQGGVIMDMGPYGAAIHRIFFNTNILKKKILIKHNKKKLPIEINLNLSYKNKIYKGKFRFGGKYKNQIIIFFSNSKIIINRAFSPPESENLVLELHKNLLTKKILIKKDNCFGNYFDKILSSIKKKNFSKFYREILVDQEFRNLIK